MSVKVYAAPWVLTGRGGAIRDGAIALDGERVVAVGRRDEIEALHGRAERLDAMILPALVNAHLHLELSHMAGRVTGGEGLASWIQLFIAARATTREGEPELAMTMAAEDLAAAGVAAVGDVSNTLASVEPLARARMAGTVYHEVFGVTPERVEAALAAARAAREQVSPPPGLAIALSPHAIYSTELSTIERLLASGPGSIHLAEDPAERALCAKGAGPFARMRVSLSPGAGIPHPHARSAVAAVAPHLRPHHLAVHCVDLDDEDLARSPRPARPRCSARARTSTSAGGSRRSLRSSPRASRSRWAPTRSRRRPRSPRSRSSRCSARAFPEVPASALLPLAWNGAAVGAPHVGALAPGANARRPRRPARRRAPRRSLRAPRRRLRRGGAPVHLARAAGDRRRRLVSLPSRAGDAGPAGAAPARAEVASARSRGW